MHENERHRIILSAVQEKPVVTVQELVDLTDSSEATIRRDIAALHVQKRLRRVRGGAEAISPPQFIGLAGRPFSRQRDAQRRQEARDRPGGGRALRGRRADHHQWRHHHLPDGAFPDRPAHADLHQFVPDRRASAQAFQEHGHAVGRHDLSRAEHHPVALRQRRDAQFLCAAHVHGRAGPRPARPDGSRSAAHPGRAEADRPGRRTGRAGRFIEIPAALEPDPVRL